MQGLFEIMVQIKSKRGIGVENPSPRSFSGGIYERTHTYFMSIYMRGAATYNIHERIYIHLSYVEELPHIICMRGAPLIYIICFYILEELLHVICMRGHIYTSSHI